VTGSLEAKMAMKDLLWIPNARIGLAREVTMKATRCHQRAQREKSFILELKHHIGWQASMVTRTLI